MAPAVEMRTERAVNGGRESRHRRDADGRNCEKAMFYKGFHAFPVNYQEMQTVGFPALCEGGTAMLFGREPMFSQGFPTIPEGSQ